MTKKDFFRLIIKTVAIYWTIVTVFSIISFLFSLYEVFEHEKSISRDIIVYPLSIAIFEILILILTIKYTDNIIKILRLDKGFDDAQIVIGSFDVLKWTQFAIIILGGLLFIENLPGFLTQTFSFFKQQISAKQISEFAPNRFVEIRYYTQIVSLVIGYLFISNNRAVARFLMR